MISFQHKKQTEDQLMRKRFTFPESNINLIHWIILSKNMSPNCINIELMELLAKEEYKRNSICIGR